MRRRNSDLPPIRLVDFHCHLDLYPNHEAILREAERLGIKTLGVTNAPRVWPRNHAFARECKNVRVGLGLHPQLAPELREELPLFEQLLRETRYVGEVGLDGSKAYVENLEVQREIFRHILRLCSDAGGKVLSVHSRGAERETIACISELLPPARGRTVLHWFTGSVAQAKVGLEAGCYFSVNPVMVQTQKGRTLIQALPRNRILTESDGPFTRVKGHALAPPDVLTALEGIAVIWGVTAEEAGNSILANLKALLT